MSRASELLESMNVVNEVLVQGGAFRKLDNEVKRISKIIGETKLLAVPEKTQKSMRKSLDKLFKELDVLSKSVEMAREQTKDVK